MVDRAREYALTHVDEPLSILDLCNHIGASRRKLQYCFQETLGINPVAYLRALRLNAVRRELRSGGHARGVQEVAARWGFWHLSRFPATIGCCSARPFTNPASHASVLKTDNG